MDTLLELVKFGQVTAEMQQGAFVIRCKMDDGHVLGINTDLERAVRVCLESAQERFNF